MPDFNQLLDKYLRNELSGAELQAFLDAVHQPENFEVLRQQVLLKLEDRSHLGLSDQDDINLMFEQMLKKTIPPQTIPEEAPVIPMRNRPAAAWYGGWQQPV